LSISTLRSSATSFPTIALPPSKLSFHLIQNSRRLMVPVTLKLTF
jgi:hypothetical protein